MEPGSCGFFAYVNPPRSPVVLEDTPLLLWSLSGPGHGQLMHNSAEFWMIILYGTVYFFWPFISSCALSLCLPPSSHYLFFVFFFFVLFIIFIQFPVACAPNDSESTVTQKSSSNASAVSRGQSSRGEAALAMCCCWCHVRCLLNQKLRTFDQPHMTAPPPCKSPPSAPFSPLSSWKPIRIPLWKVATHHLILFYVLKVANRKQIKKKK